MAGRVLVFRELTCDDVLHRYSITELSWCLDMNLHRSVSEGVSAVSSVRLERLEEDIISNRARLIILDSVASVVRKEFDTTLPGMLMQRSNLLSQEATVLKYLAHQFNIPASTHSQVLHVEEVNIQFRLLPT